MCVRAYLRGEAHSRNASALDYGVLGRELLSPFPQFTTSSAFIITLFITNNVHLDLYGNNLGTHVLVLYLPLTMADLRGGGYGSYSPPPPLAMAIHKIQLSFEAQLQKLEGQIILN